MKSDFYSLWKKDTGSNFLKRFIFALLNLFFRLEETAKNLTSFDQWILKESPSQASLKLLKFFNIKLKTFGVKKLNPKNGYLIYGNHPSMIDLFVILAGLKSEKIKALGNQSVLKNIPNLSQYIIPIRNLQFGKRKRINNILGRFYMANFQSIVKFWPREKAVAYNRAAVEKAADFLAKQGKLLLIPYGQKYLPNKKYLKKGIGFVLVKAMKKSNCKPIKLLPFFIKIDQPKCFDFLVLFRFRKRLNIKIYFGPEKDGFRFKNLISNPRKIALAINKNLEEFIAKI